MASCKNSYGKHKYKNHGIDMSAAYDTIDRDILMHILKDIVEEDELRLIQFL